MGESSISTLLLNFEKWGARSWDASFASSWSENLTSVKCVGEPDEELELASSVSVSLTASRAARNSLQGTHNRLPPSSNSLWRDVVTIPSLDAELAIRLRLSCR